MAPLPLSSIPPITRPRPRVGITMDVGSPDEQRKILELPADYANAVIRNGGLPVLFPCTAEAGLREQMIASVDALIVPGGNDLDPALYGQTPHPKTTLADADRQSFDMGMLTLAQQRKLPTLCICMGCQTLNVLRGGSLFQHLPEHRPGPAGQELQHARAGDRKNFHDVTIVPGTKLSAALQLEHLQSNSRHHQGIDRLGKGLVASAYATDGLIEAIEDSSLPFLVAVQWHPENLGGTAHDRLFAALVEAAG